MSNNDVGSSSNKKFLRTLRIIWFVMLEGELFFLCLVGFIITRSTPGSGGSASDMATINLLTVMCFAMLVTVVPVCHVIRGQIYKRGWEEDAISQKAYGTGNIVFWSGCEAVGFFGLIIPIIAHDLTWSLVAVAVSIGLQAFAFPTGRPLEPAVPHFAKREEFGE